MKILSMDPGKRNWAWALLEDGKVVEYNFLKNVLSGITVDKFQQQIPALKTEIDELMSFCKLDTKTDYICAERYMHRPGMGMGAVSEFINIQLGMLTAWVAPIEVYLISSAKWKNYMTSEYYKGEDKMQMIELLDPRGRYKLTTHESDAIGIGLYCFEMETNKRYLKGCMKDIKI